MNYKKEGYNTYIKKNNYYYLPGYTINKEILISQGKITEILEKPEFKHSLENAEYNSGAPICSADNLFVVGINKKSDNSKKINYGIFLGYILDNLEKEGKKKENNGTLLENIESNDIIRKAFNYLDEKKKLKVIKYNNILKNLNAININNYKFFTNKYIVYDTDKKGKEYNNDGNLEFEGEYLNGERNGKGKEYDKYFGKLIFEGEYLNGKRHGKGKEYFQEGEIKFEGEYINGKRWNGKGYDNLHEIIYVLKNGNGKWKEYYDCYGYLEFEGEYLNGEKHGKGKEYYDNKKIKFEGEYLFGLRWNGFIYNYENNYMFEIKNGNGKVKEYNKNGQLLFEGEYINGERAKGKKYNYHDNSIFDGEYLNEREWNGKILNYDDKFDHVLNFEGQLLRGEINGKGKQYKFGRLIFEGEYINGKKNGRGKKYYDNKEIYYKFFENVDDDDDYYYSVSESESISV